MENIISYFSFCLNKAIVEVQNVIPLLKIRINIKVSQISDIFFFQFSLISSLSHFWDNCPLYARGGILQTCVQVSVLRRNYFMIFKNATKCGTLQSCCLDKKKHEAEHFSQIVPSLRHVAKIKIKN